MSTSVMRGGDTSGDQWSEQQGQESCAQVFPQIYYWATGISSFCLKTSNKETDRILLSVGEHLDSCGQCNDERGEVWLFRTIRGH